jgi:hypothetical protein
MSHGIIVTILIIVLILYLLGRCKVRDAEDRSLGIDLSCVAFEGVETTSTSIGRFHRLSRAALRPGNEINADDWVFRFRYRPFPTQKLGRWFGQPD